MAYPPTSKNILSFLDTLIEPNLLQQNDLKVDAKPYIASSIQKEVEIDEINHTIPMPKGQRKCNHFENCEKSDCGFLHEITWYKKDKHYLRMMIEHQKEVDHILKYRIRTFPKLLSSYDEQCKYHQKMISLTKHYAEINCNDVSYLSLDLNPKRGRRNNKTDEYTQQHSKPDEYIPKNSKEDESVYSTAKEFPPLPSVQNTTMFLHPTAQESVQNSAPSRRGVFRLNENRDRSDYNSSWRS